jgi:hypothetical protein
MRMKLFLGVLVAVSFTAAANIDEMSVAWAEKGQLDRTALVPCDELPAPFDCNINVIYDIEGASCPKGDIPYGEKACASDQSDWLTLFQTTETEYSYEYRTTAPSLCPTIPQEWGPSSNGALFFGSGCPMPEARNCSVAMGGLYETKWCYAFRLYFHTSGGCDIASVTIAQRTTDLVGNDGACDASDLSGFASLIGTHCCFLTEPDCVYTGGPKYNPIADYHKNGVIDGTDLALFAAHLGHHCGQWTPSLPSKTTIEDYPWHVLDWPEMQAAMARANVDREFIVRIWIENGSEQRLFIRPNRTPREAIGAAEKEALASVAREPGAA